MEICAGLKFKNEYMPEHSFEVFHVDREKNVAMVKITPPAPGVHHWAEDWNLEHTEVGFGRGEYKIFPPSLNEGAREAANASDAIYNSKAALEDNKAYVEAMNVVRTALVADKSPNSMYFAWQSNIAMGIFDAIMEKFPDMLPGTKDDILEACNTGAINFLDLLTYQTPAQKSAGCCSMVPVPMEGWPGFYPDPPTAPGEYEVVHSCGSTSVQYWNGGAWNCEFAIEGWRERPAQ